MVYMRLCFVVQKDKKSLFLNVRTLHFKGLLLLIKQEFIRAITTLGLFLLL